MATPDFNVAKHQVAARALDFVEHGMRLGLGTGSTATIFVDLLANRVSEGLRVRCVATSEATWNQALGLGLDMTTLDDMPELDLTVDGADEFDPEFRLIKGAGGALLREKIVATASRSMVVIADATKEVSRLGRCPLPVEVNIFGLQATRRLVQKAMESSASDGEIVLRRGADQQPFRTDGGHVILDCHFGLIPDPEGLADRLVAIPGVVEHGLFIGLARSIVTNGDGAARVLDRAGQSNLSRIGNHP